VAANTDTAVDSCGTGAGSDTIVLTGLTGEIVLSSALPTLTTPITLQGRGATTMTIRRLASAPAFPVLTITNANVVILGVTLSGGAGISGGGIVATGSTIDILDSAITASTASSSGGGIYSTGGSLVLTRVTVAGNSAAGSGGGVFNSGALQIITSTLSGNTAGSSGGGIYHAAGAATLRNITVSGNTASSSGGGVFNASGTLFTSSSTIAANSAGSVGGGVTRIDGTFTLRYTLIADNGANDCFGALTSQGRNLIRNVTCTVSGDTATNITGANPLLAALADNGGPTRTHALNGGSPAANPSGAIDCEPADQRGTVRPQNGTCDIGAFEVSGEPTPPPIVPVDAPLEGTVVRGLVMNRDRVPLPNVTISVLNRPDITPILTHADGSFSLRVTGTGALTINYAKTGYLVSQRHLDARHEDYAWIEDVVLVQLDARATTIDTSNPAAFQVAQGSVVTDEDGTRQATLIIPPGTNAEVRLPNGGTQLMPSLTVRATEYTVGDTGNDAMPGELPPTIGYTYAVEYSADEAIALGATSVEFDRPIFHYVENFIDMPIGTQVPMGFYDRRIGAWVGSENGRVIRVIGITNGLADGDVNGDGIADNADLGLTPGERGTIGDLYDLGDEMFRVPIRHFTPWDANFPFGPPPGAAPPNVPTPPPNPLLDNTCQQTGSIIGCENQTLSESVAVTGSPFRLVYSSDRVPGRSAAYTLDIPLSGATLPPSVQAMRVQIDIAGRQFVQDYAPAPNQTTRFTWDGLDAYGRAVTEARPLRLRVGYVYQMVYYAPGTFGIAWGRFSGTPLSARRQSLEIVLWQDSEQILTYPRLDQTTVAGWSLDAHHRYDPVEGTLYLGDGSRRSADAFIYGIITPLAGNGSSGFSGDGGAARAATLNLPSGIASAADGAVIFADYNNHRVRRIAPDGIITTIAGTGILGYNGDGIQATTAHLNGPNGVAVAPDGSIIITEALGQRVRRIAADGIITTIAGTGVAGSSGDEGLATAARVNNPNAPIAAPDGTIYFADTGNHRVRAITPDDPRTPIVDSRIIPIAGTGTAGSSGDGGLADAAQLNLPRDVAIASDGAIYIADGGNHRVRRIAPDGIITTIAGTGTAGFSGDGSAATTAQLNAPEGVAVTAEGTIAIADTANARLRFIDPSGIITTFAGTGSNGYSGTPQPAGRAMLNQPNEIVIAADGAFVFADANNHTIRRIEPGLPGTSPTDILLPDSAGDVVYRFSAAGRHLTTLDELTGAVLLTFAYDGAGRLITITDADANVTTIARNGSGVPTAITAPYGQVTNLIVNAGGVLQRITDPTGAFVEMGYAAGALLTSYRDARANVSAFAYDSRGRLIRHQNAANGVTTLTRSGSGAPNALFTLTTPGTRVTTYNVTETAAAQTRVNTFPTGLATTLTRSISGTTTLLLPDGTISSYADIGDPRWGMLQPFTATETIITLGGRTRTVTETRAASLSNPLNPFSITSMSQTVALNGRNYTTSYNPNTRTFTLTTPVGRTATVILDTRGRRVSEQNTGLALTSITYDSRGRLATISEGTRVTTLAYNAAGYIASITDPLSRVTTYAYDLAGRLTQETLPGGR
ncbi:MAG: choice-of-anchor Q domain-containing protein, partial [Chloroflexota bacterium]|nr:choice-of-anchor Q domain-containing protein [Chloroflexota bacterium]